MGVSEREWEAHAHRLALRLLGLRAERDWSQEDLARAAGISRSVVQFLETGRKRRVKGTETATRAPFNPTLRTLYALASAYGISIHDLLDES